MQMCNGSDGQLHMNLLCPIYNISAAPGGSLPDIQSTEYAIDLLQQISKNSARVQAGEEMEWDHKTPREPFFVGLGYHKPHIPLKVSYPCRCIQCYVLKIVTLQSRDSLFARFHSYGRYFGSK